MEAIKPEDLHTMIGKEKCTSWFVVDQERINIFADVSEDPQFILSTLKKLLRFSVAQLLTVH